MEHPFLRPSASPVPGLVGLTRSQLKRLLAQLSSVSGGDSHQDIELLSEELFKQLSAGESVDLQALVCKPKAALDDRSITQHVGMHSTLKSLGIIRYREMYPSSKFIAKKARFPWSRYHQQKTSHLLSLHPSLSGQRVTDPFVSFKQMLCLAGWLDV